MNTVPTMAASPPNATSVRAGYALLILTLINLVNYLDRYIVASALPKIQEELSINNMQSGLLGTVFIVVFMLASPLGGYLGDRVPRKLLVAASPGKMELKSTPRSVGTVTRPR